VDADDEAEDVVEETRILKTPLMNQQLKLQFFDVHYERVDVVGRILMLRSQTESLRLLALRVLSFLEKSMRLWNPFL
jgi:hypothetical protein